MFHGLDLYSTDPGRHILTTYIGSIVDDLGGIALDMPDVCTDRVVSGPAGPVPFGSAPVLWRGFSWFGPGPSSAKSYGAVRFRLVPHPCMPKLIVEEVDTVDIGTVLIGRDGYQGRTLTKPTAPKQIYWLHERASL